MLAHYVIIYLAGEIESIYQAANKWMVRRIRIGIWISIHSISISDSWMVGWLNGWTAIRIAEGAKLLNNFSNLKLITIFSRYILLFALPLLLPLIFLLSAIEQWPGNFDEGEKGRRQQLKE